jgi:cobalamin-dependent methionine synthase I
MPIVAGPREKLVCKLNEALVMSIKKFLESARVAMLCGTAPISVMGKDILDEVNSVSEPFGFTP